jgi:type I restriction enzyme S subunit
VNPIDLLRVQIETPCLQEQQGIADAIDLAQAGVANAKRQLALLQREKTALMAQLLTGKRRVRLPTDEVVSP